MKKNIFALVLAILASCFAFSQDKAPIVDAIRYNAKTTAQMYAMTRMSEGTTIYNSTTQTDWKYISGVWTQVTGGGGGGADGVVSNVVLATNTLSFTGINGGFNGTVDLGQFMDDTDTQLNEAQVDAFVANNGYSTGAHTVDTDDQAATEVPVTPLGNLTSTNAGAALNELQADIDAISGGGAAAWGAITGTLSDQTDLQGAIDVLLPLTGGTLSGDLTLGSGVNLSMSGGFVAGLGRLNFDPIIGNADVSGVRNIGYRADTDKFQYRDENNVLGYFASEAYVDAELVGVYVPYTGATAELQMGSNNIVTGASVVSDTLRLNGSTSGQVQIIPQAVAGTPVLTLPAETGEIPLTTPLSPTKNLSSWYGSKAEFKLTAPDPSVDIVYIYDSIPASPATTNKVYVDGSNYAYYENAVVIPEGVKYLPSKSFFSSSIGSLTLPSTLDSIGYYALAQNNFRSLEIPANVTHLDWGALSSSGMPDGLTLNEGLVSIGQSAFGGCTFPSVIIPNSVTSIGDASFNSNPFLTSITIGSGITHIPTRFANNTALSSIIIPNTITSIGELAFEANKLMSVSLGSGVTYIEYRAFYRQDIGASYALNIPAQVDSLAADVFRDGGVNALTLNEGLRVLSSNVFSNMIGTPVYAENTFPSVTIPTTVTTMGHSLFYENTSLTSITFATPTSLTEIPYDFARKTSLVSLVIPSGITTIGASAFWDIPTLTSVTIPASVTEIGASAFKGTGLTNVSLPTGISFNSGGEYTDCFEAAVNITYY